METTVYKSKIGLELAVVIGLIYATVLVLIFQEPVSWAGVVIMLILILFTIHTFIKTYYTIVGEELFIRCGAIYHSKISVSSIKKIETSNSLLSAPATAIDRLALYYDNDRMVLISPKEKEKFTKHLLLINPNIETSLVKSS